MRACRAAKLELTPTDTPTRVEFDDTILAAFSIKLFEVNLEDSLVVI